MSFRVPEQYRVTRGVMRSSPECGNNGAFEIPTPFLKFPRVFVIASDHEGWEHVSVSHGSEMPTWELMVFIKALFWEPEDCVVQYHAPRSEYVNNHKYCLHLWRPTASILPRPPSWMVSVIDSPVPGEAYV